MNGAPATKPSPPLLSPCLPAPPQVSFGSGVLSPRGQSDAPPAQPAVADGAAAADAGVDLESAGSGMGLLSPRTSLDQRRPQRWHLQTTAPASVATESVAADLQEPLLSGDFADRAVSGTAAAAAAFAAVVEGSKGGDTGAAGAPAGAVVVARDVAGAERGETELSRALVFGVINSVATIPSLVAYAQVVFKVRPRCPGGASWRRLCTPGLCVCAAAGSGRTWLGSLSHRLPAPLHTLRRLHHVPCVAPPSSCRSLLSSRTASTPPTSTSSASFSSSPAPCTRPCSACCPRCPSRVGGPGLAGPGGLERRC